MSTIFFFFFFFSVSGQELLQITTLHHQDSILQSTSHTIGVSVDNEKLNEVSSSILMAESWLRTHVLSHYPSRNITSIVVVDDLLCDETHQHVLRPVLFAVGNVYHALVRWGLDKKIRVSVCFTTPKCVYQSHLKPVFELLEKINSTYTLKTYDSELDLGVFRLKTVNVMMVSDLKSPGRKLLLTVPSDVAAAPLPPLIGVTPPPTFSVLPGRHPPATGPVNGAQSPYGIDLPPCNPYPSPPHSGGGGGGVMAPPPLVGDDGAPASPPFVWEKLWCVAKPSVPLENLQEAMDYACGEGGADCGPISPNGSCYFPDSVVAHASYAFNSYWQKNKKNGGTCGFGGTAMLINSDPSFNECHFTIA